jgi:TetR/AcrR family transcriptional regulator, transcriptional repressor of aconitase
MSRPRLDSEERRKAIVEAAMPLFARKGFAGTTTKEIARAAEVSEALVFQHFPSKAALYQEIIGRGCTGDPALEHFAAMQPSTATLVHMVRCLLDHSVLGEGEDAGEREMRHRLVVQSFLDDGEYARLVHGWIVEHIQPLVRACMEAAERAGDLRPGASRSPDDFWFVHHVAAGIAHGRLPERDAYPYAVGVRELVEDATRFILRGIGFRDEVIAARTGPDAARPAAA